MQSSRMSHIVGMVVSDSLVKIGFLVVLCGFKLFCLFGLMSKRQHGVFFISTLTLKLFLVKGRRLSYDLGLFSVPFLCDHNQIADEGFQNSSLV